MKTNHQKKSNKLPLPPLHYERIYKTIYSVLKGSEIVDIPHSCMLFAIIGSALLNDRYKIPARPVAGAFLMHSDGTPSVLAFGSSKDEVITSDNNGFHFWVQTENHIIDFMAPIFNEAAAENLIEPIPRNMFQKIMTEESASPDDFAMAGDFFTIPNPTLTEKLIDCFLDGDTNTDLLKACLQWFKKFPEKMEAFHFSDKLGKLYPVKLDAPLITGRW